MLIHSSTQLRIHTRTHGPPHSPTRGQNHTGFWPLHQKTQARKNSCTGTHYRFSFTAFRASAAPRMHTSFTSRGHHQRELTTPSKKTQSQGNRSNSTTGREIRNGQAESVAQKRPQALGCHTTTRWIQFSQNVSPPKPKPASK